MATKKQVRKQVSKAKIYISSTFNNTLVTITDEGGTPFLFGGCGMFGFAGTRKSTPYAATVTIQNTVQKGIDEHGLSEAEVYIKGIGPGREAALRALKTLNIDVNKIVDVTPVPHNGVRPPKVRKG